MKDVKRRRDEVVVKTPRADRTSAATFNVTDYKTIFKYICAKEVIESERSEEPIHRILLVCIKQHMCQRGELNTRPTDYESVALPAELLRHTSILKRLFYFASLVSFKKNVK